MDANIERSPTQSSKGWWPTPWHSLHRSLACSFNGTRLWKFCTGSNSCTCRACQLNLSISSVSNGQTASVSASFWGDGDDWGSAKSFVGSLMLVWWTNCPKNGLQALQSPTSKKGCYQVPHFSAQTQIRTGESMPARGQSSTFWLSYEFCLLFCAQSHGNPASIQACVVISTCF